jgi:hypothetical protein
MGYYGDLRKVWKAIKKIENEIGIKPSQVNVDLSTSVLQVKENQYGDTPDIHYFHQITNNLEKIAYEILKEFSTCFYLRNEGEDEMLKAQHGWRWVYEIYDDHNGTSTFDKQHNLVSLKLEDGVIFYVENGHWLEEFKKTDYCQLHRSYRYDRLDTFEQRHAEHLKNIYNPDPNPLESDEFRTFSHIINQMMDNYDAKIDGWQDTCGFNKQGQLVYNPSGIPVILTKEMVQSVEWRTHRQMDDTIANGIHNYNWAYHQATAGSYVRRKGWEYANTHAQLYYCVLYKSFGTEHQEAVNDEDKAATDWEIYGEDHIKHSGHDYYWAIQQAKAGKIIYRPKEATPSFSSPWYAFFDERSHLAVYFYNDPEPFSAINLVHDEDRFAHDWLAMETKDLDKMLVHNYRWAKKKVKQGYRVRRPSWSEADYADNWGGSWYCHEFNIGFKERDDDADKQATDWQIIPDENAWEEQWREKVSCEVPNEN